MPFETPLILTFSTTEKNANLKLVGNALVGELSSWVSELYVQLNAARGFCEA